jgi:ATP-dependent Clp protease ATP-binding subunit ClpA
MQMIRNMDIEQLITKISSNFKISTGTFLGALALEIVEADKVFSKLTNIEDIKHILHTLIQNRKSSNLEGFDLSVLKKYSFVQSRILSCPQIDEHAVFMACLKLLGEYELANLYKPTLKGILQNKLHRLSNATSSGQFIGRTAEVAEIKRILSRNERNNVIITGEAGVGKTTLASNLKYNFKNTEIIQIYPNSDFLDQIVDVLSDLKTKKVIFFLDEIFSFQINDIKYLLDSVQIIGTANERTYKAFESKNIDIASKFETIKLSEPGKEDLKMILAKYLQKQTNIFEITFDEELIDRIVELSQKYTPHPAFPAKAISLIDESIAYAREVGENQLNENMLNIIISQRTNIPLESLAGFAKKDLGNIEERLSNNIKGQEIAVSKVAATIKRSMAGFKKLNKPIGSFLFVGPSGVGKTELAKSVAETIFGSPDSMIRLDMSEFSEAHTVQKLIGSPPGYIGFEEGGQLTNPIKEKPYSLVLLDEIEKGHPKVYDMFLQVLDDGRLTDGQGEKVDFTNSIIIATSNAGIEDILDLLQEGKDMDEIDKEIKLILEDYFRIEFINRFDSIVIFNALNEKALFDIAQKQIEKLKYQLKKQNILLEIPDSFVRSLVKESQDPKFGARGLLRLIQDKIENKLAEAVVSEDLKAGQKFSFPEVEIRKEIKVNYDFLEI